MSLPTQEKKDKRPVSVAMRLSEKTVEQLKKLAKSHNLSQADVVTHLIEQEYSKRAKKLK